MVLTALDIGKALADGGATTFRAQGTCMYPTVRPGDVLRIASRTAAQVAVGEIAVCRGDGFLFGHRVIGTGEQAGRAFILTRPDRTRDGNDGPTYDEDLLGVVTFIERRGRRVDTRPRVRPLPLRLYLAPRLAVVEARPAARARLIGALARAQRRGLYRRLARPALGVARARISYVVRLPFLPGQTDLYHPLTPGEFDPATATWRGGPVESWTLALHLDGAPRPAATASFVPCSPGRPEAGWRLGEVQVRVRYRGLGLDEDLLSKAGEILARSGLELRKSKR